MLKLFLADLKMLSRNRQASFWALMFPIMFTFIFGFFFGKNSTNGEIAIINNSNTEIAQTFEKTLTDSGLFKIHTDIKDENTAVDQVKDGKVAAVVVVPDNFGVLSPDAPRTIKVIDDPANATTNAVLLGFIDKFNTNLTFQVNKIEGQIFQVEEDKVNKKTLTYFDFVLAGILGLALMNSSIIGVAIGMNKYREDKILKRITTAPIKIWWFILGEVLSRLIMNVVQISIILAIGKYIFDAHIYGNLFVIFGVAMVGGILFQLLGFVIASFTKTVDAAQGAATAITIPMMFLGGVFFPIDTLPGWLFSIVQYLPIAPLLRIIRGVVLEGASVFATPSNAIIVMVWIVGALLLASWKFRLSDE
ncbi:MAG: ABC transporter permease [Patescibacteria group bacterium]